MMDSSDNDTKRVPSQSPVLNQGYGRPPSPLHSAHLSPRIGSQKRKRPCLDCCCEEPDMHFQAQPGQPQAQNFSNCSGCVGDQTHCTPVPLSSECTDQCVVITCTDPAHEVASASTPHCDYNCNPTECTDRECTSFDELLRCCTDYHPYLHPHNFSAENVSFNGWDSFDAFAPCNCDENPPSSSTSPSILSSGFPRTPPELTLDDLAASAPLPAPPLSLHRLDTHSIFDNQMLSSPSSFAMASPIPPSTHYSSAPQHRVQCMWAHCTASFSSLSELVGHVNLEHLRLSPIATMPPQPSSSTTACQWDNCTLYPTVDLIPGPSTSPANYTLDILANHLLHDHLGLSTPAPTGYESPMIKDSVLSSATPSSPALASPSPSNVPSPGTTADGDVSLHPCRWAGCTLTFPSHADLTEHLNTTHIGSGKAHYECRWEGCDRHGDRGFSSKQKICRHLQSHTGHRPFQCTICQQNFSEAATLQQHMRRHTQEKPYVCDYPGCGKAFAITGALTIHKRTHNGHRPFKCTYCGRGFSESSNLTKHLRTHTGDRPYPCTVPGCEKAFARPDQLTRHMSVHNKSKAATPPEIKKRRVVAVET